jgi:hypothetical protein
MRFASFPWPGVLTAILFSGFATQAGTTNSLSNAQIEGRALAQKILEQRPANNFTNTGTLDIQSKNNPRKIPVTCETITGETSWQTRYEARLGPHPTDVTTLIVTHSGTETNHYLAFENGQEVRVSGNRTMIPFAGSDFWLCDLGLEFFHWPEQKVLKKEFTRQCACTVLESTNPNSATNAYSRVVCWIDEDSLGIVEACAYDFNGIKLKDFYPRDLEKVNGQYQVGTMVMENSQTGSKSTMEFDLGK